MTSIRLILAIVILLIAAFIVVMNWGYVIASARNLRRGIDRRRSTIPVVSIVLVVLAQLLYPHQENSWMYIIPLVDIGNWSLLWFPVRMLRGAQSK